MAPSTLVLTPDAAALPRDAGKSSTQTQVTAKPTEGTIQTVDGLLRHRARAFPDAVIVSYPSTGIEYVDYTAKQLDTFAYRVGSHYQNTLPSRKSSSEKPMVVGLLGPSNFDYLVTMLALIKLGHTILFLSTRIPAEAVESLMKTTGAQFLLADSRHLETAQQAVASSGRPVLEIASKSVFDVPVDAHGDTALDADLDPSVETGNNVYIIHSSGSTGFPKPIYQRQSAALANYAISMEMKAFITLPLYHNHGICNFFRAIHSVKPIHMYNADLPLTSDYLTRILRKHKFEIFYGVPYALKLLIETEEGINLLQDLKVVMYGGSACPDELGDLLVDRGVNLVSHYGATEVGQLMTSFRPSGDRFWNYVREHNKLAPFLRWIPRGPNLFECAVTEGWPAKVAQNQEDGSYNTKDLFEPHPAIEGAWKYIARLDDTLTMVNGEKFNPVQMEGRIRSDPLVAETVIFGAGRPFLGLLVVPSPATEGLAPAEIADRLWPVVEAANQSVEAYARISPGMVTLLPHRCSYPRTDKGSIIRQAFYKDFAEQIQKAYDQADSASEDVRAMDAGELKVFLREALSRSMSREVPVDDAADFFSFGVDSLQAIQLRSEILKNVDVANQPLGQNVAFDHPSVDRLAAYLISLREGKTGQKAAVEEEMQALIEKYSQTQSISSIPLERGHSVAVTGVTGSLGAHVAAQLIQDASISRVFCLVRAKDTATAFQRVEESLRQRRLYDGLPLVALSKLAALPFTQSDGRLGLSEAAYGDVAADLGAVIHCAWAVNFNMALSSFESDCLAGVSHLLRLCRAPRAAGRPAAIFAFCSSVSAVARVPAGQAAPEHVPDLAWAQGIGYAQSKNVAEHVCARAGAGAGAVPVRVLRVGQIVGDTVHGVWNATEAIPLMMQTAHTVGCLPRLPEDLAWLPVDTVARAVVEISFAGAAAAGQEEEEEAVVANVVNARTFHWTRDLLPALRRAGLQFDEVAPREWIRRLRASEPDPQKNPPIKLVDFLASKYDRDEADFSPSRRYETETAARLSPALAGASVLDQDLVNKFIKYFSETAW